MQLRALFEGFGPVVDVRILRHEETGASKGWGTVKFEHFTSAALATSLDRSQMLPGADRPLRVNFDEPDILKSASSAERPAGSPTSTCLNILQIPLNLVRILAGALACFP